MSTRNFSHYGGSWVTTKIVATACVLAEWMNNESLELSEQLVKYIHVLKQNVSCYKLSS